MGKKRLRKSRTSNGVINLHNRKVQNAMRRDSRENPSIERLTILIENDRKKWPREIQDKRDTEKYVNKEATRLYEKYQSKGAKWSACVQAVKTSWIPQFETKWYNR